MKRWLAFVAIGIAVAFAFEVLASALDPKNRTFDNPGWPVFVVLWYGFLHSLNYVLFSGKRLWIPAVVWACVGTLLEIVVFHRVNPIVDPIIYGLMFTLPHILTGRGRNAKTAAS